MSERPILFTAEMVRAILDGRKTQTRRVCRTGIDAQLGQFYAIGDCPYGGPGDRLWVRETFAVGYGKTWYKASDDLSDSGMVVPWKSGRFMPRDLSRITLEIVKVRVERVQEIMEGDAIAEGLQQGLLGDTYRALGFALDRDARGAYEALWDSINGKKHPWQSNPWVWVIEFKRL